MNTNTFKKIILAATVVASIGTAHASDVNNAINTMNQHQAAVQGAVGLVYQYAGLLKQVAHPTAYQIKTTCQGNTECE